MKRQIVKIDEDKCTGCGLCVPNCAEGALQIIDGKVRLVSDLLCDGLGACLGHCPEGAIEIEEREAEPYNEIKVMDMMVKQGKNTVIAHLKHLKDHNENGFLKEGITYLIDHQKEIEFDVNVVIENVKSPAGHDHHHGGGCPGMKTMSFAAKNEVDDKAVNQPTALTQWPVQMHLVNPAASYFQNSDLLLAADCTAFALGNFHSFWLKNKSLAIACPKLDSNTDVYIDKLVAMIDQAKLNTITVLIMEVPCCGGLIHLVKLALDKAARKVPVKKVVVGIQGEILQEEWI
ncbi:MAG: 4Fe-4S ferredoxin [Bacteroidetes bacterium HGW-Bacteroidetes-21]|jgi:NAD-dependent dihydropyrimidine dehydrogenase PreA subunit|nr:MAG: 4Fe-4S ferredoxin [Bacteroidetes bacterium HGW-Bacteroidetes-21]